MRSIFCFIPPEHLIVRTPRNYNVRYDNAFPALVEYHDYNNLNGNDIYIDITSSLIYVDNSLLNKEGSYEDLASYEKETHAPLRDPHDSSIDHDVDIEDREFQAYNDRLVDERSTQRPTMDAPGGKDVCFTDSTSTTCRNVTDLFLEDLPKSEMVAQLQSGSCLTPEDVGGILKTQGDPLDPYTQQKVSRGFLKSFWNKYNDKDKRKCTHHPLDMVG